MFCLLPATQVCRYGGLKLTARTQTETYDSGRQWFTKTAATLSWWADGVIPFHCFAAGTPSIVRPPFCGLLSSAGAIRAAIRARAAARAGAGAREGAGEGGTPVLCNATGEAAAYHSEQANLPMDGGIE